ncbi:MAG: hypothetical protein EXS49_01030 [Candidatus Pacebacteria bacterium]|nr:hypothetical protein [Candidatus Paceibacterota bacterium]
MKYLNILKNKSADQQTTVGFTLIETILYSAILVIFLSFSYTLLNSFLKISNQSRSSIEVSDEANFILSKINYALNQAQLISFPATNTSSLVSLEIIDYNNIKNRFDISGNNIFFSKNGVGATVLNSSTTIVSFFSVDNNYHNDSRATALKINFTVKKKLVGFQIGELASTTISTTYVLQQ